MNFTLTLPLWLMLLWFVAMLADFSGYYPISSWILCAPVYVMFLIVVLFGKRS